MLLLGYILAYTVYGGALTLLTQQNLRHGDRNMCPNCDSLAVNEFSLSQLLLVLTEFDDVEEKTPRNKLSTL